MKIPKLYLFTIFFIVLGYVAFDYLPVWLLWIWAIGSFVLSNIAIRAYWKANTKTSTLDEWLSKMKKLIISVALVLTATLVFASGHSNGFAGALLIASWLCGMVFLQDVKVPVLNKRFYGALLSLGFFSAVCAGAFVVYGSYSSDYLLIGLSFAAVGWFFEDIAKFV
jgi:accessory gene regulator protein AgrB